MLAIRSRISRVVSRSIDRAGVASAALVALGFLAGGGPVAIGAPVGEFELPVPEAAELLASRADGLQFPEGPLWTPDGTLLFSDPRAGAIYEVELAAEDSEASPTLTKIFEQADSGVNGLALGRDGKLYVAAGGLGQVLRIDPESAEQNKGEVILADIDGQPLNAPNDLVFAPNGDLYVTNPAGLSGKPAEGHTPTGVVRITFNEDGSVASAATVTDAPSYPNGIAFSPDGKTLYVNDTLAGSTVWAFDVAEDGSLGDAREFHKFGGGAPDGMTVAESGNIYAALHLKGEIVKLSPEGEALSSWKFPRGAGATNTAFGGEDFSTLFITLGGASEVWAIPLDEPGLKPYGLTGGEE